MSQKASTLLLLTWLSASSTAFAQNIDANRFGLPVGVHPHLNSLVGDDDAKDQDLNSEIKFLGHQIKNTVKYVTAKRGFSCLGAPCNIKAFPLMYTKRYSGFWGGAHIKFTNESRTDPYLYAVDLSFQRSDTQQYEVGVSFDAPRLIMLPYQPRFKLEFNLLDTNEVRYFGQGSTGTSYEKDLSRIDQTRYNLEQYQVETQLAFKVAVIQKQTYSIFAGVHSSALTTEPFQRANETELFKSQPRAFQGGVSGAWTLGIVSDSRDSEFLARSGWMLEGGVSMGGVPVGNYKFSRIFLNDRRFFSYKRSTIAHRLTFDVLSGEVPFWEFKRVAGTQPIADIASSDILRSYYRGRFHESFKIVESLEWRYNSGQIWLFGLKPELIAVPIALNFGRLGESGAWSASTGGYLAFTKSFMAQLFTGYSPTGWDLSLLFGVNI
jgi:hypothetical protein